MSFVPAIAQLEKETLMETRYEHECRKWCSPDPGMTYCTAVLPPQTWMAIRGNVVVLVTQALIIMRIMLKIESLFTGARLGPGVVLEKPGKWSLKLSTHFIYEVLQKPCRTDHLKKLSISVRDTYVTELIIHIKWLYSSVWQKSSQWVRAAMRILLREQIPPNKQNILNLSSIDNTEYHVRWSRLGWRGELRQ